MLPSPFTYFNPERATTINQGHLPHWDQASATYFITWRTNDSMPKSVWEHWFDERSAWLREAGIDPRQRDWRRTLEERGEALRLEFTRRFSAKLEEQLDECHGACVLRDPATAEIVARSLRHFHGERYRLGDFVIMPNHVHLIVGGVARDCMLGQVEGWKRWTGRRINERLGQRGRFWQAESFDHLVRSREAHLKFTDYIIQNPAKARLRDGFLLGAGSPQSPSAAQQED